MPVAPADLTALPLFHGLSPAQLAQLAALLHLERFSAGAQVFAQGAPAAKVYVLVDGAVDLCLHANDGGTLTIAHIGVDGVFGWSAALGRGRYTSAAQCVTDCVALSLRGAALRALIREDEGLGNLVLGRMALTVAVRDTTPPRQLTRLIQDEMARAGR
jgi:CRP-like cAMP-binding protein